MDPHSLGYAGDIDLEANPTAKAFVKRCHEFINEIADFTPGKAMEEKLNAEYGPGTPYFEDFTKYMLQGLKEGWVASTPISGPEYRRGRILSPCEETRYLSINTVYMESPGDNASSEELLGQYHKHPYGEVNCVIPVHGDPRLMGMQGWQGAGWTSPGPGTHHYPQVKGGGLISLFFLPSGRISYKATPGTPQPLSV